MQLVVGRVVRAHGIRGEVSVDVRTDDPDHRFAPGSRLEVDRAGAEPLTVQAARVHHGRLLVTFAGVGDRDAAQALAGTLLLADSGSSREADEPDEYWDHDLVGLAAVDPAGVPIGTVADVLHGPGGDTLVIDRGDAREALVPFVHALVPTVDLAARRVVVDAPPGLLEL